MLNTVPTFIDSGGVTFATLQETAAQSNFYGPLQSAAGDLYVVLLDDNHTWGVWRSVNGGATWTRQDVAHEAPASTYIAFGVFPKLVGNVIEIAAVTAANDVLLLTFDCTANLWGAPTVTAGATTVIAVSLGVLSTGDRVVFYTHSGNANLIEYNVFSGGAWAGAITVTTAAGGHHAAGMGLTVDASDNIQFFYWTQANPGAPDNAALATVALPFGGPLGAPTALGTVATALSQHFQQGLNTVLSPALAGGTYAAPYWVQTPSSGLGGVPEVILGKPASAPVWVTTSPDPTGSTVPAGSTIDDMSLAVDGTGRILCLWVVLNQTTGIPDQLWGSFTADGATWSAPVKIFDAVLAPPPGTDPVSLNPGGQAIVAPMAALLANGLFGLVFNMTVTVLGFSPFHPALFALFGAVPPILTLTFKGYKVYAK
jgi:hypothetical protein